MSKFLIKGIYLILIIMTISIVINQIVSLNVRTSEEGRDVILMDMSTSVLETLTGSKKCLGYEEPGSIEGRDVKLTSHRIIDVNKLNDFSTKFSDIEPDCARNFKFGYKIKVETLPINVVTKEITRAGGVFGKVLELINGKRVVFVMDSTGSMSEPGGKYQGEPVTKLECVKIFMKGFIDQMNDDSVIALYVYINPPKQEFPFTPLPGNRIDLKNQVDTMHASGCTPMCKALEAGFNYAEGNNGDIIVLLTDGCENCDCYSYPKTVDVANNHKSSGIPVHTISFGKTACPDPLIETADITGGEYFDARTCEELITNITELLKVKIEPKIWVFGDAVFSEDEALEKKVSVSIPIIVYYNESTFIPGKIEIVLVDGELESLIGFIEKSCSTGMDSIISLFLHYPVSLEVSQNKNYICMEFNGKQSCQRLACDKQIEFGGIKSPGNYKVYSQYEEGVLKIIV